MWTLARFLPIAIGHLVPNDNQYWLNYVTLLKIMELLFAPKVTLDDCGYLETLIDDHHSTFKELYPAVQMTLKLHNMIHMPRLMIKLVINNDHG